MIVSGAKRLGRMRDASGEIGYMHFCPGCRSAHAVWVEKPNDRGARWTFNGNLEQPTFQPSALITVEPTADDRPPRICHYFLEDGQLRFLSDSTHALSGQTIELPTFPEGW